MKKRSIHRYVIKVPKNVKQSMIRLMKSTRKLKLAKAMRQWVERTPHIHALNYWYYRWFTNDFELFLIDNYTFEEKGDNH